MKRILFPGIILILALVGCGVQGTISPDSIKQPSPTRTFIRSTTTPLPNVEPVTETFVPISTTPQPVPTCTRYPQITSPVPTLTQVYRRPWRIMPLGDSLTSGTFPGRVHSYRGYLEGLLLAAGYSFDFVGTQTRLAHGGSDSDHEGHSGFSIGPDEARFCLECDTANLYDHLDDYLTTEPDIVLLLIGINDLIPLDVRPVNPADAPQKLAGLVLRIQQLRPGVFIFVASLAPINYTDAATLPSYQAINQMAEEIGTHDSNDQIYFVDLNREMERTMDRKEDFADGVHLAEGGARKMAQIWFDALVASGMLSTPPPER